MRLIRCSRPVGDSKEIQLELCEQHHIGNEAYAILSHKWGHPDDEITFNVAERQRELAAEEELIKIRSLLQPSFAGWLYVRLD